MPKTSSRSGGSPERQKKRPAKAPPRSSAPVPTLQVVNPFDQSLVAEVPFDDLETARAKLVRARLAYEEWRRVPLEERLRRVEKALEYFRRHEKEIAHEVTRQMGKPLAQARNEVNTFFDRAKTMMALAPAALAPEPLEEKTGFRRRIEREPVGVVLDIAAWNYPLIIPVNVVVPALLAGNSVLLKHSPRTPLCGLHFERAFAATVPAGLVQGLTLTDHDADALIAGGGVDHVAFTGSVEGGRTVYQVAARRLIGVGLELGGKDPAYVAEDADLDFTVENVVDGACYNAGQSCCAVERVYVHQEVYPEFLRRAQAVMERYRMGNPLDEATTLGPLAIRGTIEVLESRVEDALAGGARLLLGGKRAPRTKGNFFPPTLISDLQNDMLIMQEESFGPILPVMEVSGDEEALRLMNQSRFGLTASVWTRDAGRAEGLSREIRAGTIFRNRCDFLDPALPWTGWGDSGLGSTLSRHGFEGFTRLKSIHFREGS